jgi:CRP-like cAMP-binding protein
MISTQLLRSYPHFSALSEDQLVQIANISDSRQFNAGDELFVEGAPATHFCLIKSGEVNIVYMLGDNRIVDADTLIKGDAFGWSALVEPHRMTASCIANKNGEYIAIEADGLRHICNADPTCGYSIALEMVKLLRDRLSALRVQIAATH